MNQIDFMTNDNRNADKRSGENRGNPDNFRKNMEDVSRDEDLKDSPRDEERLQSDATTIELPDVEDIPGQEHVHVPPLGELADTTISSDDEEGRGIFDSDQEEGPVNTMRRNDDTDANR